MQDTNNKPVGMTAHDEVISVEFAHRVRYTNEVFAPTNTVFRDLVGSRPTTLVAFLDSGIAAAQPGLSREISEYCAAHAHVIQLVAPATVIPGGEIGKNDPSVLQGILAVLVDSGVARDSIVLAVGGGAVLDVVGFAAATLHRGVRMIRVPTTTLSQGDSGVAVKNAINALGRKNLVGTFSVPWGVINDPQFLRTLTDRDWIGGLSEAVKVALLKDGRLFRDLELMGPNIAGRNLAAMSNVVRRSADLHLSHIVTGGDPFEVRNARPLDLGHWSAHKLEQASEFQLRHGEAVAIGVALDAVLSHIQCGFPWRDTLRVLRCLSRMGLPIYHDLLQDTASLMAGIEEFRMHLGGELSLTLLQGIGRPVQICEIGEVDVRDAVHRLERVGRNMGDDDLGGLAVASG